MRVAVTQFAPKLKEPKANLRTALSLVGLAAQQGAQLVVLPELCLSGYSLMSKAEANVYAEVLAPGKGGPFDLFRDRSARLGVAIVWGCIEKDPGTGDLYNSQVMALPGGSYTSYRKLNRFGQDYIWATEGRSSPPVVEYLGLQIGMLICRDVRDESPEWKELYEPGDADLVTFSANWGAGGFPASRWVEFAQDNSCWLAVSNRYGKEANNNFGEGGICLISPTGEILCEGLVWGKPCIVMGDID